MEAGHVRHNNLPGAVNSLPCREYQVRELVTDLPWPVFHLMLRLRCISERTECLVDKVVAELQLGVLDSDKTCSPPVAVRRMGSVCFNYKSDNDISLFLPARSAPVLPLVVARPAYFHNLTQHFHRIFSREYGDYLELFSLKRIKVVVPSSFFRTV